MTLRKNLIRQEWGKDIMTYFGAVVDEKGRFLGFLTASSKNELKNKASDYGFLWKEPRLITLEDS